MENLVAIIGRPNVGKSTFFNRMLGMRQAIVDDVSGVTRDRQYGVAEWNGKRFNLVDTGGFIGDSDDIFAAAIRNQVSIAIEQAQVIIFMVDVMTGITDLDEQVGRLLHNSKKPVLLVANKVDNNERQMLIHEFWALGFDNVYPVCSNSGSGTGEILDDLVKLLPGMKEEEHRLPHFAIIGRPNAGKSSFVNLLMGEDRSIVTDIAGTTRDSIHAHYNKFGNEFILVDTAGIRRKRSVKEDLEFYSVLRALRAIEEADVCILMLDATQGIETQDLSIFRIAMKNNKGVVILVNKWDLVEKDEKTILTFEEAIKERLKPNDDVPILFVSVLEKQRVHRAVEAAMQVYKNRTKKITTSKLNDFLEAALEAYHPPSHRGKMISIKYAVQLPTPYPSFVFFCNHPKHVTESYKNYLENKLRESFDFCGVPVKLFFREK
jgi:GTP-binding protein